MLAAFLVALAVVAPLRADGPAHSHRHLVGTIVDYTKNHGADRRFWSPALEQRRDMYVYLPPGFDPCKRYPVMIWLHGIGQDERSFPDDGLRQFDAAMAAGRLPPMIVAIPDGTIRGESWLHAPQPLFVNSNLGAFEDYIAHDVWGFMNEHYPICPERTAHIIAGYSGGGGAAYRIAIRYRDQFGIVFASSPPLNVRWVDCHGRYFANFDPDCWGWRTDIKGHEVVGRFYGVVNIRLGRLVFPLYGPGPQALDAISRDNPIEMLDACDVRPGQLSMLVAYGGRDQFNIDAQVESFIYRAHERGLEIAVCYCRWGGHNLRLAERFIPEIIDWLAPQLAPPPPAVEPAPNT
jgi:hypothetical protein